MRYFTSALLVVAFCILAGCEQQPIVLHDFQDTVVTDAKPPGLGQSSEEIAAKGGPDWAVLASDNWPGWTGMPGAVLEFHWERSCGTVTMMFDADVAIGVADPDPCEDGDTGFKPPSTTLCSNEDRKALCGLPQ
ncbi:MAG: hypothetical protein ACI80V_002169 [Rhodothermales bacterium]|jgi:hypothetical protein